MAKIAYTTLVDKLVDIYSDSDDLTYLWSVYQQTRAEYDRVTPVPMDWEFYLHGATTDANIYNHTRKALRLWFSAHGYDWLREQYKISKQK